MDSSKMQSIYAPGEFPITHSSEEESSRDSSIVGTRPATPEFGQAANRGSLEQHTPDTTPESIRVAPRRRKDPVHLGRQRNIDLATTSILSEAPSIEEIADTTSTSGYSQHLRYNKLKQETSNSSNHSSHHSIDSQVSEEASITSCPDRKKGYSAVVSIYNSVITFFNLARRQKPRADSARVQDAIKLIKSLPRIRRTRFTNLRRPLTASQYDQLLVRIQNEEFEEKLRFEYTHSISQFEIRMTTPIHEGIVGEFNAIFTLWREELKKLRGSGISDVAETLRPNGNQHVKLPLDGATDPKSPDGGIKHKCNLRCKYPALVFEVEFANNSREELRDKAEAYIVRSGGEIRTVVAVYMGEMHIAERKNERRLKRMYRTGQVDESEVNSYPTDENNVTGKASILVWRARTQKNNKVSIGRVQEQVFRDPIGKPIQSASIRISLEDCVCKGDIVSAKSSKAPLLEITAEALCKAIDTDLREYREERAEVIRTAVQKEKQKKEKLREEERIRRAAEERTREGAGVLGRVMEQGRLFSARLIDRKL